MELDYWLYMNEAAGCDNITSTRLTRINAIGKELVDQGYKGATVPGPVFFAIAQKHNMTDITEEEIRDIEERWL